MNLARMFGESVAQHGARPVIHEGTRTLSYKELGARVCSADEARGKLGLAV